MTAVCDQGGLTFFLPSQDYVWRKRERDKPKAEDWITMMTMTLNAGLVSGLCDLSSRTREHFGELEGELSLLNCFKGSAEAFERKKFLKVKTYKYFFLYLRSSNLSHEKLIYLPLL